MDRDLGAPGHVLFNFFLRRGFQVCFEEDSGLVHMALESEGEGLWPKGLTPTECARLQGFPDDWLDLPGVADGPKYRALGNAVTVPVIQYLGERIIEVLP